MNEMASPVSTYAMNGVREADREISATCRSVAQKVIEDALPKLKTVPLRVRIDFGDGNPFLVDCLQGAISPWRDGAATDCSFCIRPENLIRIVGRQMDTRAALLFGQLQNAQPVPEVLRFLDGVTGQVVASSLPAGTVLPQPTTNRAIARRDLEEFGYCLVKDALSAGELSALRQRVVDQAAAEREAGCASLDGGATKLSQRIWNVINKGRVFHDLLLHPLIEEMVPDVLGDHFIISSYSVNIAGPGSEPQLLHYDQISMQPTIQDFPIGLNIAWFLDDVTEENGGTRLLPGSHKSGVAPANPFSIENTIAAAGPAGTALIFDSRVWHGTGGNVTSGKRHVLLLFFNRYFMRAQENFSLSLDSDVAAGLNERVKVMLGFRCTGSLGGVEGPVEGQMVSRPQNPLREMASTASRIS